MKKILSIILIFLAIFAISSSVFASENELTFGTYPMVPGGLQRARQGMFIMQVPSPVEGVRMQAADKSWTTGTLPCYTMHEGKRVPVYVEASIEGDMIIAHRAKICGNTLQNASWPVSGNYQAQQQKQTIVVQVVNQAPQVQKSNAVVMNSQWAGKSEGPTQMWNVGQVENKHKTWNELNQKIQNGNFDNSNTNDVNSTNTNTNSNNNNNENNNENNNNNNNNNENNNENNNNNNNENNNNSSSSSSSSAAAAADGN